MATFSCEMCVVVGWCSSCWSLTLFSQIVRVWLPLYGPYEQYEGGIHITNNIDHEYGPPCYSKSNEGVVLCLDCLHVLLGNNFEAGTNNIERS